MKKVIAMLMTAVMVMSVAAGCSFGGGEEQTPNKTVEGSLETVIDKVYEKAPAGFAVGTITPAQTEMWDWKSYTGLDSNEKVKDAAVSEAIIGSIGYSMVLVRVNDAADAKTVAQQMKDGIDQRKWICALADDMKVAGYGDVIMLVMIDSSFASDGMTAQGFVDAFKTVCGGEPDFIM
jgi:hypothetical protein